MNPNETKEPICNAVKRAGCARKGRRVNSESTSMRGSAAKLSEPETRLWDMVLT